MADAGPQAPPLPPAGPAPQALQTQHQPVQPVQLPIDQNQPVPTQHVPQLNWSHFKVEFAGKPEVAEVHLLRTNDLMYAHAFQEGVKVQRFCLTLVEARLWC